MQSIIPAGNLLSRHKWLVAGTLVVLIIIATATYYTIDYIKQASDPTVQTQEVVQSSQPPSESRQQAEAYAWKGAGDEPKRLEIPKIGVSTYIQPVGIDSKQRLATPNNIHLVGWYKKGAKPGQRGLAIIDGHVGGRSSQGVFEHLLELAAGDTFQVILGNNTTKQYRVLAIKQVPINQAGAELFSQSPNVTSQLNLITCGGEYDDKANTYVDRVIVSAVLL